MKPGEFLKGLVGHRVRVRLNDGSDFFGKLVCLDGFMNVALQETTENGVNYGTAFLRGNHVLHISKVV